MFNDDAGFRSESTTTVADIRRFLKTPVPRPYNRPERERRIDAYSQQVAKWPRTALGDNAGVGSEQGDFAIVYLPPTPERDGKTVGLLDRDLSKCFRVLRVKPLSPERVAKILGPEVMRELEGNES